MTAKIFKTLALIAIVGLIATVGYSQGQINFFTYNAGNSAKGTIFLPDGITAAGSGYYAQLWGSLTSATANDFHALGPVASISTGWVNYGVVSDNTDVATPGGVSDAGNFEWYQVRVWNVSAGSTWGSLGLTWTGGGAGSVVNSGSDASLTAYGVTAMSANTTRVTLGGVTTDGNNSIYSIPQANNFANLTLTAVAPVPEPSTMALAALGGASMLLFRRRK